MGRIDLAASASRAGTAWTDDGTARQERGVKHRADNETRIIPVLEQIRRHGGLAIAVTTKTLAAVLGSEDLPAAFAEEQVLTGWASRVRGKCIASPGPPG